MKASTFFRFFTLILGIAACVGLLSASVTQEVPRGGVHIIVTMSENHKPLPKAWVELTYKPGQEEVEVPATSVSGDELEPTHKSVSQYHRYRTNKDGEITVNNLPAGLYAITGDARAHNAQRQLITLDEAKTNEIKLELDPNSPYLELYSSKRVFTPDDKPSIEMRGFDPANKATIGYYKLDLSKIAAKGGLSRLLYSFSRPGNEGGSDPTKSSTETKKFDKAITSKDVEGIFTEPVDLPKLDEGFYYVTCQVGDNIKATYLNISTIGLITETSGKDALCYVADLVSGKPIKGAGIEAAEGAGFHRITSTDDKGLARVTVSQSISKKALVLATYGKSKAVVDFDNESSGNGRSARIFIYSDRPIYRPGDTIQFKGIVRALDGLKYKLPGAGEVKVQIRDSDETTVKEMSLPLSAKGTFNGEFATNVEDKPGEYTVNANYNGAQFTYFATIAAYRKPEFSIKVESGKKFYVYGDKASATVKAEYYFGGPVIGAKVEAYVTRRAHYSYDDESDYMDYASDEGGDSSGGHGYYQKEFQGEYNEKIEATTNAKGEAVIAFDTKTEDDPDIPDYDLDFSVSASITDASGKYFEGSGDVPVKRGDVTAALTTDRYIVDPGDVVNASLAVKRQADKAPVAGRKVTVVVGYEEWNDNKSVFTAKETLTGVTDAKGIATIPVKVGDEGSLVLKSTVSDEGGRPVKSVDYVYVEGDRTFGPPEQKFDITLDKKSYHVGDRCKVLIETSKAGGSALVTVQAEKIYATYVVDLTKKSSTLTIPVTHDYAPNVWVSAVAIENKKEKEASSKLVVDLKEHDLNVAVTPDKADYLPGDTANVTIKTTDSDGRPVPADLSLGVVDESIYALRADDTNLKKSFYPMRQDSVRTNYSFEEIYLDGGDKAGLNIPVRTKFLDTASWQPSIETDANGIAHTSIKLPDNLTSWRATAVGVSDSTQIGMTRVNFRARKPLSVRLELPSFLVQQDSQKVTVIVTNDTGQDAQVNVRFDAKGVGVGGQTLQKVSVSAARPVSLTWDLLTNQSGTAQIAARVWIDGGANDGEQRNLPIESHGRLIVESHAGEVRDETSVNFDLSRNADRYTGRLNLSLSPTLGTTIYQSLDDLINFPYGCTEQTMSRFLPTVMLASTLKQLNIRSDLQARVPDIVSTGFARLAKMQHSNGAWGWWEYDSEDRFMTAYVLDGLKRAKAAGFESDKINEDGAIRWAKKQMKEDPKSAWGSEDFLYLCFALAEYGSKDAAKEGLKRVSADSACEVALLALADHEVGDEAGSRAALAKLHGLAKVDGDIAHFPRLDWEYGDESVDFPLIALTTLVPQDPLVPKLVRYLVADRKGDMWFSTRDSSFALIGLIQYMKQSSDTGSPLDIEVSLNGAQLKRVHFDPANQFSPDLKISIPVSKLSSGPNRIEFRRLNGTGLCYFSGDLRQIELADHLLPVDSRGLTISRDYHLLEPQQMEDGNFELRPTKKSIEQAKPGDLIRVEITVASSDNRQFMMVEDPIPSGCRITEREYVDEGETWGYWWSQIIVRDDRAAFFMRYLTPGIQKLTYTMRVEQLGIGHALPPTISNMYDPAQTASGCENLLKVEE